MYICLVVRPTLELNSIAFLNDVARRTVTDFRKAFFIYINMEIWKDIKGYEGFYQVSNIGKIKSLSRLVNNHSGFKKNLKEKILKTHISKTGYYVVDLKKNNERKTFKIHRLIAIAFIDKVKGKEYINHINGIKTDNSIKNLEWVTIKENNNHAVINGLKKDDGVNNSRSNLKENDVLFIRNSGLKLKELSFIYNLNQSTISKIKLKKTYKNI